MADVIARLDAASEGSRELDALVWVSVLPINGQHPPCPEDRHVPSALAAGLSWSYEPTPHGRVEMYPEREGKREMCVASRMAAHYTTSLDAALTLVPEGFGWSVGTRDRGAWKIKPEEPEVYFSDVTQHYGIEVVDTVSSSPALALCIAALKARNIQAKQK